MMMMMTNARVISDLLCNESGAITMIVLLIIKGYMYVPYLKNETLYFTENTENIVESIFL